MITVSVCVGSSCHVRGSRQIIEHLQGVLHARGLDDQVDLRAEFCLGHCMQGPNVRVNDEIIGHVSPDGVDDLVEQYIVPHLRG